MREKEFVYPLIDKETTGKRLRLLMHARHISARQLQGCLGLSCVQSVYRWLDGTNIPSVDNLYAMSELFQVPMDSLIAGNRPPVRADVLHMPYGRIMAYYLRLCKLDAA